MGQSVNSFFSKSCDIETEAKEQEDDVDKFFMLSTQAIARIFGFLSGDDLKNCRLVSKKWDKIITLCKDLPFNAAQFSNDWMLKEFSRNYNRDKTPPFSSYSFDMTRVGVENLESFLEKIGPYINKSAFILRRSDIYQDFKIERESENKIIYALSQMPSVSSLSFILGNGSQTGFISDASIARFEPIWNREDAFFKSFQTITLRTLKFKNRALIGVDLVLIVKILDKFPNLQNLTISLFWTVLVNNQEENFDRILPFLQKIPKLNLHLLFADDEEKGNYVSGDFFIKLAISEIRPNKLTIHMGTQDHTQLGQVENQAVIFMEFYQFLLTQTHTLKSFTFKTTGSLKTNFDMPDMVALKKFKMHSPREANFRIDGRPFYLGAEQRHFPALEKVWLHSKSYKMFSEDIFPSVREVCLDCSEFIRNRAINYTGFIFPNLKHLRLMGRTFSRSFINHILDNVLTKITHLHLDAFKPLYAGFTFWTFFFGEELVIENIRNENDNGEIQVEADQNEAEEIEEEPIEDAIDPPVEQNQELEENVQNNFPKKLKDYELIELLEQKRSGAKIKFEKNEEGLLNYNCEKQIKKLQNLTHLKIGPAIMKGNGIVKTLVHLSVLGWLKPLQSLIIGSSYDILNKDVEPPQYVEFLKNYHHNFRIEMKYDRTMMIDDALYSL